MIRRFLSAEKFRDLIRTCELFFCPASKFIDQLEGRNTKTSHATADRQLASWGLDLKARERAAHAREYAESWNRGATLVMCWTMENISCKRMWDEYGGSADSVAIETTVGLMRTSLGDDFLIARVHYIDENSRSIGLAHSLEPYLHKRMEFQWEKEMRIIAQPEAGTPVQTGRRCRIDLAAVIRRIIVNPGASQGFLDEVHSLARSISPSISVV